MASLKKFNCIYTAAAVWRCDNNYQHAVTVRLLKAPAKSLSSLYGPYSLSHYREPIYYRFDKIDKSIYYVTSKP